MTFKAQAKTLDEIIGVIQTSVLDPITNLLLVLGAVVFLYGVVEFIAGASAGQTSSSGSISYATRARGKRHMVWGLLGLLIMVSVKTIIAILQNFFA